MKFRETTLGEISGGGSYGLGASSTTDSTGPKFLRTTDIVSGTIDWSHVPYCSADSVTIAKYKLFDEDIVISRTGANAGLNCLVLAPPKNAIFAGYLVRFQINRELADARYVSYVLRSSLWKDYVEVTRTGSAQPQFNAVLMSQFPISLPSLNTQKAISTLLSALDAKIAVNNGLSKTLEDIAQAIFKSWFIDFDPVKAKMAGEKSVGLDAKTATLFPDSLVDSELGLIPFGWQVESLGGIASIYQGKYLKPIEVSPTRDMDAPNPVEGATKVIGYSSRSSFDFDFSSVSCRGSCGFVRWISSPAWISNNLMAVYGKGEVTINYYLHYLLRSLNFESVTTGSVQGQITISNLSSVRIILDIKLAKIFNDLIGPIHDAITALERQSAALAEIRETLLPRLISGELQIPEEMLAS